MELHNILTETIEIGFETSLLPEVYEGYVLQQPPHQWQSSFVGKHRLPTHLYPTNLSYC